MNEPPNRPHGRARLPIYEIEERLVSVLGDGRERGTPPRVVVEAPTGSGKSTQVPQILLDRGLVREGKQVVVLEPRRIAARMLARRVAGERGGKLGGEVGYQVRFEREVSGATRIRYVTEGIVLRELLADPGLPGVGTIVFDEFHERHLYGDVTLARALDLQESSRPDLKLVVMSATLQAGTLAAYLGGCPVVRSEGRTFPVEVRHVPPRAGVDRELADQVVRAARDLVAGGLEGDILVFLPGAYEIRRTAERFRAAGWAKAFDVRPLYGDLPPQDQDAAVAPSERPKIVVATNVAETSITIEGVRAVIDSGLARVARYDARRGINTLTVEKIAADSADQRAGRAGRTAPGVAVRLWSARDHAARPVQTPPEVTRLDLAEVVLALKAGGVGDVAAFRWLDPPDPAALARAVGLLEVLGAVDPGGGAITEDGMTMLRFPVHPRHAKVLIEGMRLGCFKAAALAVALCEGRPLFRRGSRGRRPPAVEAFAHPGDISDFQPQIRAFEFASAHRFALGPCDDHGISAAAARDAARHLAQLVAAARGAGPKGGGEKEARLSDGDPGALGRALLSGFPDHVAVRAARGGGSCAVVDGRRGTVADSSVVKGARVLVAAEITEVEGREVQVVLSQITAVEEGWLEELFPDAFRSREGAVWDPAQRRVVARQERLFLDLVLESRERGEPPPQRAAEILAAEVLAGTLVLKGWDHKVDQWVNRVNSLAVWMPELEIPAIGDDDRAYLIAEVCHGAKAYREIKDRSPWPVLQKWLSEPQRAALETYAPETVALASGRRAKLAYHPAGEPPTTGVILQDLYNEKRHPTVAGGRVPVRIEILAPNRRPVQVTDDLPAFWKTSYPEVRKQLRGRYPKHEWKPDP